MKKIFSALVLVGFLVVLAFPLVVSAQQTPTECCKLGRTITVGGATCAKDAQVGPGCTAPNTCSVPTGGGDTWGMMCLLNTLYKITDWVFVALVALAAVMTIMGAFALLTSAGDPAGVAKGRNYILYAAIGLVVGFLAKAVPSIVQLLV